MGEQGFFNLKETPENFTYISRQSLFLLLTLSPAAEVKTVIFSDQFTVLGWGCILVQNNNGTFRHPFSVLWEAYRENNIWFLDQPL